MTIKFHVCRREENTNIAYYKEISFIAYNINAVSKYTSQFKWNSKVIYNNN
jgi:hypothetical protein